MSAKDNRQDNKISEMGYMPQPRAGGYLKIKLDVKEKKDRKVDFQQFKNISSRVEDMEREKYKVEKNVVKCPIPPIITQIRSLNLPIISQESLFDKCTIEDEDNDDNQGEYEQWLNETAPANDNNLMDNFEEAINFIVLMASNPDSSPKEFDEMQAISVVQFLRTIKLPTGQYETNNARLMEYIDLKAEESSKNNK